VKTLEAKDLSERQPSTYRRVFDTLAGADLAIGHDD
jgi:hypothetical protein